MGDITVVGLDISLACTGIVAITGPESGKRFEVIEGLQLKSPTSMVLEERCELISRPAMRFLRRYQPHLCVVEGGARGGKIVDLNTYHLAGVVRWRLWKRGILTLIITPGELKVRGTGSARRRKTAKAEMLAAARIGGYPGCPDHNCADAFWAAVLGLERYGLLVEAGE